MAAKRKGLGRGLDALLSGAVPAASGDDSAEELRDLPIDLIQPGKYQPRVNMRQESLQDLADSIKAQGLVQPIVVRPVGEHAMGNGPLGERRYEIIAGERRWRAAQMAGMREIPAGGGKVPGLSLLQISEPTRTERSSDGRLCF